MLLGRRAAMRRPASGHSISPLTSSPSLWLWMVRVWLFVSVIVCHLVRRPRVIYEVDAVARWGPYFIGDLVQLYCIIPASFMQRRCRRVADHRLTCQPILTYCLPSITLQSALALDAGSVRLCSANTWSHRRVFLFPYPATDEGGDSL